MPTYEFSVQIKFFIAVNTLKYECYEIISIHVFMGVGRIGYDVTTMVNKISVRWLLAVKFPLYFYSLFSGEDDMIILYLPLKSIYQT
jgi:hypothetical protein